MASHYSAPAQKKRVSAAQTIILILLLAVLGYVLYLLHTAVPAQAEEGETPPVSTGTAPSPAESGNPQGESPAPDRETDAPEATPEVTPEPTPTPLQDFAPYHTEATDPSKFVIQEGYHGLGIQVNGVTLDADETYTAAEPIDFGLGRDYTEVEGIITFRGNNFRDTASYGAAEIRNHKFGSSWSVNTGTFTYNGETWSGSGWVGQPLIVKWPKSTKAVMNMYDWAKADDDLVEVIYATMDGNIYFLDLATGNKTRDNLNLGFPFKGAGALDPRGWPILYVGAGYDSNQGFARAFVVSLIDFKVLHSFGHTDTEAAGGFTYRGNLSYFDGSALVDADTDQLIYPGENGILYIVKLNTVYNETAGTLSMNPETVKWRYYGVNTSIMGGWWVGMEDSAVIWRSHLIIGDNGGRLMCLDLNTLTLDWVQDIVDDSNTTPVLSIENGHPYVYTSASFHYGWRSYTTAPVPIFKIDAENGEVVWRKDYTCYTEKGVSGGVQSTMALGKNDLEGYVYVTVAKTDIYNNGILVCLDRETGEVVWEYKSYYTWSSPVLVYDREGHGSVIFCNYNKAGTDMYWLNALTGEVYDSFNLGGGVEASPAVYENTLVIGTRQCKIWGIQLT